MMWYECTAEKVEVIQQLIYAANMEDAINDFRDRYNLDPDQTVRVRPCAQRPI